MRIPPDLRSSKMLDQDGRYVGDWYSVIGVSTAIISTGNRAVVYPLRF